MSPQALSYQKRRNVMDNHILHDFQNKLYLSLYSIIPTFNPFPNKPWFLQVCSTSLLKTLREKEKLLVMSNFSFSHRVFSPLENYLPFSLKLELSSANSFSSEESKICCSGKVYPYPFTKLFQVLTTLGTRCVCET